MMVEQLEEIGFRKAASGGHWMIGGGKNPTVIQVTCEPGQLHRWSVHADNVSMPIPTPGDIQGVYNLLKVFGVVHTPIKTTHEKLVANKWLPVEAGVFRTVDLEAGKDSRLYYSVASGHLYAGDDWVSSKFLRSTITPEEAQKIFLCLSAR